MNIYERIDEAKAELESRIEDLNEELDLKEMARFVATEEENEEIEERISEIKYEISCLEAELDLMPEAIADNSDYQHMVSVESRYW